MSALSRFLDHDEPTVTAPWIARQLGHRMADDKLEAFLAELVRDHRFPPPLPHWKWGGGVSLAIDARRSHWRREAVAAWLDDFLPPEAAAALDAAAMRDAADDMDAAAANLRLVGGTECRAQVEKGTDA